VICAFVAAARFYRRHRIKIRASAARRAAVADLPGWRMHGLRHHFASRLVQEGTDINVVREAPLFRRF
jgi:site-specific recombinase XerD